MEMIPKPISRDEITNCGNLNCTVRHTVTSGGNTTLGSCKDGNSSKIMNVKCLEFTVRCAFERTDNNTSIDKLHGENRSRGNNSWKISKFCLKNLTMFGEWSDNFFEKGSRFVRELFIKDGKFMNCEYDKLKVEQSPCDKVGNEKMTAKEKHMRENTKIADIVFIVLLSIGLLVFILMGVYTRKTLKLCCNMCFEDEI